MTPRFREANHAPEVRVLGSLERVARPGSRVVLRASARDPDGNRVRLRWWRYDEVDSYGGPLPLAGAETAAVRFTVPGDAKPGDTLHLILETTDDGAPALSRYQRVVVHVAP